MPKETHDLFSTLPPEHKKIIELMANQKLTQEKACKTPFNKASEAAYLKSKKEEYIYKYSPDDLDILSQRIREEPSLVDNINEKVKLCPIPKNSGNFSTLSGIKKEAVEWMAQTQFKNDLICGVTTEDYKPRKIENIREFYSQKHLLDSVVHSYRNERAAVDKDNADGICVLRDPMPSPSPTPNTTPQKSGRAQITT